MFKRPPSHRYRSFHPPTMPFGPGMIKEMSQLVFLWTVAEETEGITGYDLQKNYDVKQTNVYRTLKEMEDQEYLSAEETIISGRAQKIYKITEKGKERLKELREKWTNRIAFLTDIVPPERFAPFPPRKSRFERFVDQMKNFESKEEAIEYLEYLKEHFSRRKTRLENQKNDVDRTLAIFDDIIEEIKRKEKYDSKDIEPYLLKFRQ
ncbi:MAG TPA: PadR family transcriptional regulator [candidate division Zixibacteria bacterium]|nr:PadR family transcriptional regulator [candidate division Zixibacteria bacterium]